MARISTYPIISTPTLNDLLIGTDVENLNETKNFALSDIGDLIGQFYVPYIGATGNVNLGAFSIEAAAFIVPGGLASQFVKADGSLDSTAYVPEIRTITINGTTYDLSANRTWTLPTLDNLTTLGTGGAATYSAGTLNIPVYQSQGNYITQLSGEATALGPGNATITLDNAAVIAKVLTGLNITGGSVVSSDSILQAFGKVQNQINSLVGGVQYQGTWNAATNNPFLQSSVGTKGYYYVVSVPGNTNLNGITDWKLGDWAIFDGTSWGKVDNTDAVVSVNGYTGAVILTYSDVGAPPATRTLTINGTGYDLSADRSWTVGDVRTDQFYADPTWITSLGWSKITGTPTTLAGYGITDAVSSSVTLTINGVSYDLSANRTWNVGTVTSVGTSGPLTGGTITSSGTIGITQAGPTSDGYLSAADWNEFNTKLDDLSATAPITYVAGVIGITQSGAASNGYLSSVDWNTFNNKQDALTNPVTGTGTVYTLPMWSGATTLTDSPVSYATDTLTVTYNSITGGNVNFTNVGLTPYTYSIQMNNFGAPRSTYHQYTDGDVVTAIGGVQMTRILPDGRFILGTVSIYNSSLLQVYGDLYVDNIVNATTDTDKFLVSNAGVVEYRTGSEVLSDIGGVPSTRTLTINGTAYDLSADRSWSVGTVTSVDMSVPAGFTISNNPITSSGTLAIAFASGYSLPTNASQANWTTAYNDSIISAAVTGTGTKTLTLNQQDGGTVTATWTDEGFGYVPYTGATQNVDLGEFGIRAGYFQADTSPTQTGAVGRLIWNNTDGTLNLGLLGGNVTLHIGQQEYARVVNGTGSNVLGSNYQAVKIIGAQGQRLQVGLSRADNDFNSKDTIGLIAENINNNNEGFIITNGLLEEINTTGSLQGETWSDGDTLYLSGTTFGQLTNIKPSAPIHTVIIGFVAYSHANHGKIFVKVDNGYELEELHDVAPTPYVNNGVLYRDTTTNLWKSATIATLLGYTPANQAITLTINGTTYDLSANRTWSVGTVTSITAGAGLDGGTITTSGTISHSDTSSQASVDNTGGFVIQDVTLDTFGHVTGLASIDLDGRYVPLTRTLNGLSLSSNQTFATGTTGSDFNIVSAGTVHTFNIPDASSTARGLITATAQTINGTKTFLSSPIVPSLFLTNMGAGSGAVYYDVPENRLTVANYNVGGEIKFEVNGGVYTMALNSDLTIELMGYTTNGILRTSGSNGTLVVDTTAYTPQSRTLTINGTAYDLTADRSWSVGTVTSVGLSVPTGFSIANSPITGSGTLALTFASGYSLPTNTSQANWDTAYDNRITSLTTTGTSGAATLIANTLNIPIYQAQGNYITSLTGEATASGPGAAAVTLSNSAVTGKVLTGLTVTGTTISSADSILSAFGKLQGQINDLIGGLQYQGTWNASTNTPTITSGVGTDGYFYIVSVAGTTNIDGITDWQVGDWIVFHGSAWQKVDNTDSVTSVNGFTGAVTLTTSNISEGTNLYFTDSRARQAISLTTTGNSGAATYSNVTGILNVPQYTISGIGGVPTTRSLTINGTAYDLSADRTWNVGTVTSIATTGPITGGTITGSGTIGITQATTSTNGYLSSTDWNTFNNKQNTITLTTTGNSGSATLVGATLNIPNYTLGGLGGVPDSRTLTINGTSYDLSANRTWSVGTVTSITFSGPLTGGTITGSGTVGITQATTSTSGYLSSTDWNTFNNKQNALTNPVTGTGTSGYFAKFNGTSSITSGLLYDNGSAIALGTTSINAAALFQMDSTTKGFLPPRMTQAQRTAITTPPEGLIVYQTNGTIGLYIYANATWRSLTMV